MPFKMSRFVDNAEAVYKTSELVNQEHDRLQSDLRKEAKQHVKDKYFIKRNISTVHKMDRDKLQKRPASATGWQHKSGELP